MFDLVREKISKNNILRVGINMSNFLLVNKDSTFSNPKGLSPDIGALLAKELDLQCQFISFKNPGELADATDQNKWDVGNFAFEKKRAEIIDFSNPYINIDANFIMRKDNKISKNEEVDTKNLKIAVVNRSAYDLWLSDNFKNAKIVRAKTIIESHKLFNEGKADVLAGLKPKLVEELEANKNLKIIDKPFTFIKQSIGIKKGSIEVTKFLNNFILKIISEGTIERLLKKHKLENKLSIPKNY
jgi:polar amino acid transport system substrate-binding protein